MDAIGEFKIILSTGVVKGEDNYLGHTMPDLLLNISVKSVWWLICQGGLNVLYLPSVLFWFYGVIRCV
jgi:hypothetical protein